MCILYGDWLSGFCILVAYICCSQLADILSFWVVIFACSWAHKLRQFKFSRCRIWAQPVMQPCPMLISCIMCVKKMCCMMRSRGRWCPILKTECAAFALDPAGIQRKMEEVNIVSLFHQEIEKTSLFLWFCLCQRNMLLSRLTCSKV
jgi:hypothetical protein